MVDSRMTETSLNGLSTHLIRSSILSVMSRGAALGDAFVFLTAALLTGALATVFFAVTITYQPWYQDAQITCRATFRFDQSVYPCLHETPQPQTF